MPRLVCIYEEGHTHQSGQYHQLEFLWCELTEKHYVAASLRGIFGSGWRDEACY